MVKTTTPEKSFHTVVVDTIGPLKTSEHGNQYAITLMCNLTKYLIAVPLPNKEARTIAQAMVDHCILVFGPMTSILSDRGTEYVNSIIRELCQLLKIEQLTSTAYHHQTLGTIERNHRVLNEYLRTFVYDNQNNWDSYLKYFTYCYNTTPHTAFKFKYTPFELVYGKIPITHDFLNSNLIDPIYNFDFVKQLKYQLQNSNRLAKQFLELSKDTYKTQYDKNINKLNIKEQDEVLLTNETANKLDSRYLGPFIIKKIDGVNAIITDLNNKKEMTVHKNRLDKYKQ